jgi:hypothetical protein
MTDRTTDRVPQGSIPQVLKDKKEQGNEQILARVVNLKRSARS